MSIKLTCSMCGHGSEQFVTVDFLDADGVCSKGYWCDNCRAGRPATCDEHGQSIVVFIDNTKACRDCVEEEANLLYADHQRKTNTWYQALVANVDESGRSEFYTLVRRATEDGLPEVLCVLCSIYACSQRFGKTADEVVKQATAEISENHSLIAALLPSSDPDKKFKGKPPETS